eukprot:TRINITY_DN38435_c0_g1_i1.p1 TRINITY_DN38435_c0_g1~~TRINITY_DN38435_c0_g1_i1.p1  ORF type:complete len:118 (-),score=24.88 TRINITY_DN38435_c0_g1_i1:177-530(-)
MRADSIERKAIGKRLDVKTMKWKEIGGNIRNWRKYKEILEMKEVMEERIRGGNCKYQVLSSLKKQLVEYKIKSKTTPIQLNKDRVGIETPEWTQTQLSFHTKQYCSAMEPASRKLDA